MLKLIVFTALLVSGCCANQQSAADFTKDAIEVCKLQGKKLKTAERENGSVSIVCEQLND
jgi:hypothetical protein